MLRLLLMVSTASWCPVHVCSFCLPVGWTDPRFLEMAVPTQKCHPPFCSKESTCLPTRCWSKRTLITVVSSWVAWTARRLQKECTAPTTVPKSADHGQLDTGLPPAPRSWWSHHSVQCRKVPSIRCPVERVCLQRVERVESANTKNSVPGKIQAEQRWRIGQRRTLQQVAEISGFSAR